MKKYIFILFAMFYLIVTSGMALNIHYCGGKIKSISFFHKDNEKGCCGTKKKSKGCCKDKKSFIKLKDTYKAGDSVVLKQNNFDSFNAIIPIQLLYKNAFVVVENYTLNYHAPPVIYDNPLYLKNRILLI